LYVSHIAAFFLWDNKLAICREQYVLGTQVWMTAQAIKLILFCHPCFFKKGL